MPRSHQTGPHLSWCAGQSGPAVHRDARTRVPRPETDCQSLSLSGCVMIDRQASETDCSTPGLGGGGLVSTRGCTGCNIAPWDRTVLRCSCLGTANPLVTALRRLSSSFVSRTATCINVSHASPLPSPGASDLVIIAHWATRFARWADGAAARHPGQAWALDCGVVACCSGSAFGRMVPLCCGRHLRVSTRIRDPPTRPARYSACTGLRGDGAMGGLLANPSHHPSL